MDKSKQEEVIGTLWIIAALIAFSNNYQIWGWIFAINASFATICSIVIAYRKAREMFKLKLREIEAQEES